MQKHRLFRFMNKGGYWQPDLMDHDSATTTDLGGVLPDALQVSALNRVFEEPLVNEDMQRRQAEVTAPSSIFEMVKFGGSIFQAEYGTHPIPRADWPATGRGRIMEVAQSPNVVSGNLYARAKEDRYGPLRDPRIDQTGLNAFLQWALPGGTALIEQRTNMSGWPSAPGYGAPGG